MHKDNERFDAQKTERMFEMKLKQLSKNYPKDLYHIQFYADEEEYEMSISLFDKCNLKCEFCFERHSNRIDTQYIEDLPCLLVEKFKIVISEYKNIKVLNLRIWGGELFFDALDDSIFQMYFDFTDKTNQLFAKHFNNVKLRYSWLSNGVFTKYDRVEKLLNYSNGVISFSYDPIGRFSTQQQKDMMLKSYEHFFKLGLVSVISITLTKQTVKAYVSGATDIDKFKDTYIDINFYSPNNGWESLLLSADDLYEFFEWAILHNLTNCGVISCLFTTAIGKTAKHYCDCKTSMQIAYGMSTVDCAIRGSCMKLEDFYGKYVKCLDDQNNNEIKAALGMKKMHCLECQYFNTCQMPCWITVIFKGYKYEYCPYQKAIQFIQDKMSDVLTTFNNIEAISLKSAN